MLRRSDSAGESKTFNTVEQKYLFSRYQEKDIVYFSPQEKRLVLTTVKVVGGYMTDGQPLHEVRSQGHG